MDASDPARPVALAINDVRSVHGRTLELPLGALTVLVGPNRAGASNLARAFALALDEALPFVPERDLPRGRDRVVLPGTQPWVRLTRADGSRRTVHFDAATGASRVENDGDADADASAGVPRTDDSSRGRVLVSRIQDTPKDLLRPLVAEDPTFAGDAAHHVAAVAGAVLGEDVDVTIDEDGRLDARDELGATLPVPELRALAAIGVVRTLSDRGRPPVGVVLEAPEAFLHPAAQESIAAELLALAVATGVPVVATTTSPFALPRRAEARVVALTRDAEGRTRIVGSAHGDAPQARLLGGLVRDEGLASVLDRTGALGPEVRAVLVVEGGTDVAYLTLAAERLGRTEVLDGLRVHQSGGAMGAALAAIVLRAESDVRVLVLLDHDDQGRRARDTLVSRFDFDRKRDVLTYADVFTGGPVGVEAEALFATGLLEAFVRQRGRGVVSERRTIAGTSVPDLTSAGKSAFVAWVEERATREDLVLWDRLLDVIAERLAA